MEEGPPVKPPWSVRLISNPTTAFRKCESCGALFGFGIKSHSWEECANFLKYNYEAITKEKDELELIIAGLLDVIEGTTKTIGESRDDNRGTNVRIHQKETNDD